MKYEPEYNPFKDFKYASKEQLGKHLDLVKLRPREKKPYYCTLCSKIFLTLLGASNHVDFVHTEEVLKILKGNEVGVNKSMKYCCERLEEIIDDWVFQFKDFNSNGEVCLLGRYGEDDDPIYLNYCPFCGKKLKGE
jgi:hypothetical protein